MPETKNLFSLFCTAKRF